MKKIIAFLLAATMVFALGTSVMANPHGDRQAGPNKSPGVHVDVLEYFTINIFGNGNSLNLRVTDADGYEVARVNRPANNRYTEIVLDGAFDGYVLGVFVRGNSILRVTVLEEPEVAEPEETWTFEGFTYELQAPLNVYRHWSNSSYGSAFNSVFGVVVVTARYTSSLTGEHEEEAALVAFDFFFGTGASAYIETVVIDEEYVDKNGYTRVIEKTFVVDVYISNQGQRQRTEFATTEYDGRRHETIPNVTVTVDFDVE